MKFGELKEMLVQAGKEWVDDKAPRLGAALAYYTIFSLAPLLVIAIAIVGFVLGDEAARGGVANEISSIVGPQAAEAIQTMIANAGQQKGSGIFATIFSVILLLVGASGVVVQLKESLNTVWDVPEKKSAGVWGFIRTRFLSFAFVLGMGFLLLVSLLLSTFLAAAGKYMGDAIPMVWLMNILNFVISFGVITLLLALMYKFLPDIKLPWKDVWLGAVVTAALFTIGKFALGVYLGRSSVASAYGAAGSLVVMLVWVYYSAQILFFGAELTQVYSRRYGAWKGTKKRSQHDKDSNGQMKATTRDATPEDVRQHHGTTAPDDAVGTT